MSALYILAEELTSTSSACKGRQKSKAGISSIKRNFIKNEMKAKAVEVSKDYLAILNRFTELSSVFK
jgi:hypothetical protein